MAAEPRYVIIGASLAGAKAAETLRGEGFDGAVVLVGAEPERPYERPPLSKGFLTGTEEKSNAYVHEEGWYAEHDVELRLGVTAVAVDRAARRVELANGASVGYDKLLITTGASPRRLNVPGADLDGVLYLRTIADSERLMASFKAVGEAGGRVVIAGAGWIGLETAAAARHYGREVRPAGRRGHLRRRRAHRGSGGGRHRGAAQHLARRVSRAEGGGRGRRGRRAEDLGSGYLRGRRRRQCLAPVAAPACPGRALGERAEQWASGCPIDARPAGELRPGAVLLQRSVRARHGSLRVAGWWLRPGRVPRRAFLA